MSMMESMSTMRGNSLNTILESVFLSFGKEYWERALSQAEQDHERQQRIQREVHGENQNTQEQIKVKVPPKPYEPTKEERQSHEATQCPLRAWCEVCVKAKSPDVKHAKQVVNPEHILVIEFDDAFATDTPGDPKISKMVANRPHSWINFCGCGKEKRWPGRLCDAEFPKLYRSVGCG